MFELTADEIALLNDEDLRSLVGRLCESEVRRRGIVPSCVTWGGNQNAGDGGLDVHVVLPVGVEAEGFIPRPNTGFQVKAEDTPPSKIRSEMRPKGVLRSAIVELAAQSGAYIIVSSKGSVSDAGLRNRRASMTDAISDVTNIDSLLLDFYDRKRLETWLRDHPGTTLWVRERIGKPLHGWSSYGAWSYEPGGADSEYLLDKEMRIRTCRGKATPGISAIEGIQILRDTLRHAKGIVRLVGLSGVGKTRLVQALFDNRVGKHSLDPAFATYTNLMDDPKQGPLDLAKELINGKKRAVLIVDNCRPDLHERLSDCCRSDGSTLSLITVEYDIREDLPEGTDVFHLEVASINLTKEIITSRFPELSQVNTQRIAAYSGGNPRIAIALAKRVTKDEAIAQLSDQELFRRLFEQRNQPNEDLLSAAQALSLVYSFEGENINDDHNAELSALGSLVEKTSKEMFRHSAELERRGLVQRRSRWRAILPPAIANQLAATALQNIPLSVIESCLVPRERLLKSFSRRLGYLHDSKEARLIASLWLGSGGMLEKLADLNDLGFKIFSNIAPIAPERTLSAIEACVAQEDRAEALSDFKRYLPLIRSLAYDASLFDRSIETMVKILAAGDVEDDTNGPRNFTSLFPLYLSGTRARIDQRLSAIRLLILSHNPKKRTLGLAALRATLETLHFGPGWDFEFGAHSRDFGWWPQSLSDVKQWFEKALALLEELACSDHPESGSVRRILSKHFRGLWTGPEMHDELERICRRISEKEFWTDGWIAVRQTIYYDANGLTPEAAGRLSTLESALRPQGLLEKVRSIVLSEGISYVGTDSTVDSTKDPMRSLEQVQKLAQELGRASAADQNALAMLLPELLTGRSEQLWSFGCGLAEAAEQPRVIWNQLVGQLELIAVEKQNVQVLHGFLNELTKRFPQLANDVLDDAVENDVIGPWLPVLQTAVGVDSRGVNRLLRSIEVGKASVRMYYNLAGGGVTHQLSGGDFNRLLMRVGTIPEGLDAAIHILSMRVQFARDKSSTQELIDIGCELLRRLTFTERNIQENYNLTVVVPNCLIGRKGAEVAREICRNLKSAVAKRGTYIFQHMDLLQVLFRAQPLAALDGFCGGSEDDLRLGINMLDQTIRYNPFDHIPESDLMAWCDQAPQIRYTALAAAVNPYYFSNETGRPQWTSVSRKLLEKAPDRVEVLKLFINKFSPMSWRGSRAEIVESNAKLLDELASFRDPALLEFIAEEKIRLAQAIQVEKQTEALFDKTIEDRFE